MKVHVFQHVPFEGLGAMEPWLLERRAIVDCTRFFAADRLPSLNHDLLIVLGGPMSVNDESRYPWLADEKRYIARAVDADLAVLGVCLGSQLIAAALGAQVYPNRVQEIGWFSIEGTGAGPVFERSRSYRVFQWHGETFDLPKGATWLASSNACAHQAFLLGRRTLGLQFHAETTPEGVSALVNHCRDELVVGPYIQTESQLLHTPKQNYVEAHRLMRQILEFLTA